MKDLLQIYGTIPIKFQNASYNIPIIIFMDGTYPYTSPVVFVTPLNGILT